MSSENRIENAGDGSCGNFSPQKTGGRSAGRETGIKKAKFPNSTTVQGKPMGKKRAIETKGLGRKGKVLKRVFKEKGCLPKVRSSRGLL